MQYRLTPGQCSNLPCAAGNLITVLDTANARLVFHLPTATFLRSFFFFNFRLPYHDGQRTMAAHFVRTDQQDESYVHVLYVSM